MTAPILVTGATGQTGSRVAAGLRARGEHVRAASRRAGAADVRFDWYDPATHAPAIEGIERLYLVQPIGDPEPAVAVRPVLELAVRSGLRRVVLLSSSAVEPTDHGLGGLQRLVSDLVPEWAILRPSWFMQNFTGDRPLAHALRAGLVRSATGRGRTGFVDTRDIADVAVEFLARDDAVHDDFVLTGPEALSYADVCDLAGGVYGWRIEHESIAVQDQISALQDAGVPAAFAEILAAMDDEISRGAEDRVTDVVTRVTGHAARTFEALLRQEHTHRPLAEEPTS